MRIDKPLAIPGPNVTGPAVKTLNIVTGTPIAEPSSTSAVPPTATIVVSDGLTAGAPNFGVTLSAAASLSLPLPPHSRFSSCQLPPPPKNVELNLATTQITDVPFIDSFQLIPEVPEKDINEVQGWMKTDKEYEGVLKRMKERMTVEMNNIFGSAMWWEEGSPGMDVNGWKRGCEIFEVRYPEICGDKRKWRREGLKLPRKLEPEEADKPEELVPIRLEFDVGHHRMKDTFVWNLNDPVVTPDVFAQSIVDDYTLAPNYHPVIVKSIQEQLCDYRAHSFSYDQVSGELLAVDLRTHGRNTFRITTGSAGSKKKRKLSSPDATVKLKRQERNVCVFDASMENNEGFKWPMVIDEIKLDGDLVHEELRILIKLDIIVGAMRLEDQFEWDLESGTVTPEEFSKIYTQDLGLGGEFKTAIAHCIRDQVQIYRKSLFLVGHPPDGAPIQDEELRHAFLPRLFAGARPMDQVPAHTPTLSTVSSSDLEQIEKKLEKGMNKRRKRNQRGRSGIAIPGREPVRTHRTPANGFPEIDPATLALAAAANTSCSRRAAAATASLMIANIIASENDPTDMTTTDPTSQATKEKKPKVLLKAPTVLPLVLVPPKGYPPPLNPPPPPSLEPKMKIMPKKPAKDLERTAMEKEFADGQYPNWIDGVWHCSNCGCPKSVTMSRRSGPLGERSLCGLCGKFWHKHRRPRPVEYNPDTEFHTRQGSDSKTPVQYKAAVLRARRTIARSPRGQVQQVRGATAGPFQSEEALQETQPVEDFQLARGGGGVVGGGVTPTASANNPGPIEPPPVPTPPVAAFPPTNAEGQRICRLCGLPGRYKDGKCVERWGPGPMGPGIVCDRCQKRMKRLFAQVEGRGLWDQFADANANTLGRTGSPLVAAVREVDEDLLEAVDVPNATDIPPTNPGNSPLHLGAGSMNTHHPSAISISSLQRPSLPLKLDLSSASML